MTPTQIAAILMLLQAFGVSPSVIATVQNEITPSSQAATQATTTPVGDSSPVGTTTPSVGGVPQVFSTTTPSGNSTVIVLPSTQQPAAQPVALIVPVCSITGTGYNSKSVYLNWRIDPHATATISSGGRIVYAVNGPGARNGVGPVLQTTHEATYTLTETMTDPAYQPTTTCQTTVTAE